MAVVLMTTAVVSAQKAKVPKGCVAVERDAISHDGYTSRVIHRKTGVELLLFPAGSFTREGPPRTNDNDWLGHHGEKVTCLLAGAGISGEETKRHPQ